MARGELLAGAVDHDSDVIVFSFAGEPLEGDMAEEGQDVRCLPQPLMVHGVRVRDAAVPEAEGDECHRWLLAMGEIREEQLSVLGVGRSIRRRKVISRASRRDVGKVRVRRVISGEEIVSRRVEPADSEVRRRLGAVSHLMIVFEVVPVAESVELVLAEELGTAEVRLALSERL